MPNQTIKLTQRIVEKAAPETKEYYLWDNEIKGLGLRVIPTGGKTYVLKYRNKHQQQRKYKIGNQPDLKAEKVREIAQRLKTSIAEGVDPTETRREDREQITFKEFQEIFISEYAEKHKKSSSVTGDKRMIR